MNALRIESTKFTPKILFDPENGIFLISGFSLPENVSDFYAPVLKWLNDFSENISQNLKKVTFSVRLIYYNSGSFKVLIMILNKIVELQKQDVNVQINWYYDDDDYQLRDIGEELSDLVGLPFNFVSND